LLGKIPASDVPLREYVRRSFPKAPASNVDFDCFGRDDLVGEDTAKQYIKAADALLSSLARMPSATIEFRITSLPAGSPYQLVCPGDSVDNSTDSLVKLYRGGPCDFSIVHEGYKRATLTGINLVDTTPREIKCNLAPLSSSEGSVCWYDAE